MKNKDNLRVSRTLWITGLIVLLFFAFFIFQRSLAANSRKTFEAEWAAIGVPNWRSLVPKMPSEDENFFTAPIVRWWLPVKGATNVIAQVLVAEKDLLKGPPVLPAGWFIGQPSMTELREMPAHGTSGRTLEALGLWLDKWNPSFAEFREAGKRPYVQLPGDYSSPELVPVLNFVTARSLVHTIVTRARVHLLQQHGDLALLDLDSVEVIMRALESRPATLVAAMIRVALADAYVAVVKDGLEMNLWKPDELDALRSRLERIRVVPTVLDSLREGEMAGACFLLQQIADAKLVERRRILGLFGSNNEWQDKALAFLPSGSVRRNQLLVARLMKGWMDVFERDGSRYYPKRGADGNLRVNEEFSKRRLGNVLAGSFIPNVSRALSVCARTQTRLHQAVVTCALESYRATHRTYPESLADLQTTFTNSANVMPKDIVSALPFVYRQAASNSFILYSVGEDGVDDGGSGDDWVW